jgi:hypothetical protein
MALELLVARESKAAQKSGIRERTKVLAEDYSSVLQPNHPSNLLRKAV